VIKIIQNRLDSYDVTGPVAEENALKEIVQEIALFALWRAGFFEVGAFQGGTSLRILHGLPRFSEDLDFILQEPDRAFTWQPYLKNLIETFMEFGIEPEVLDKKQMDRVVKTAIIKGSSIAKQLNLNFKNDQVARKLTIKLEIDTNPPAGSEIEYSYLDFPVDFEVCHQDKRSNFALKIHALLSRKYLKGRDWYDFGWYVSQGVLPNLLLLENALEQSGPWRGETLNIDWKWLKRALEKKITSINWKDASADVERFLKPIEMKGLSLWSDKYFLSKLEKLVGYLK